MTEKSRRNQKLYETKVRNVCANIQAERSDVRLVEFYEDQVKNYEFRLGITPAILDASLVKEQQIEMEK